MPFCYVTLKGRKPLPASYPREVLTLGDHIRKRRLDLGLLQRGTAERIGVDVDTLRNWEQHRNEPALRHMPAVIEFLGYAPYDPS